MSNSSGVAKFSHCHQPASLPADAPVKPNSNPKGDATTSAKAEAEWMAGEKLLYLASGFCEDGYLRMVEKYSTKRRLAIIRTIQPLVEKKVGKSFDVFLAEIEQKHSPMFEAYTAARLQRERESAIASRLVCVSPMSRLHATHITTCQL